MNITDGKMTAEQVVDCFNPLTVVAAHLVAAVPVGIAPNLKTGVRSDIFQFSWFSKSTGQIPPMEV